MRTASKVRIVMNNSRNRFLRNAMSPIAYIYSCSVLILALFSVASFPGFRGGGGGGERRKPGNEAMFSGSSH